MHRYCAGVSVSHYEALQNSPLPFLCSLCVQTKHSETIEELKATITALKEEVKELHVALESSTSAKPGSETAGNESNSEWTDVVKRNRQRPTRNSKPRPPNTAARSDQRRTVTNRQQPKSHHGVRSTNESTAAGVSNGAPALKDKVKASGVRRVWGTLKETTTRAVSNTITKVCGINPKKVKRSFKKNDSGRIFRWWFIIRDSEDVLSALDAKWQQIQIHTSWKLEPCYITQTKEDTPPAASPSSPQSPVTPLIQGDATARQPADNTPSVVVETMSSNEEKQETPHAPSHVSGPSSSVDVSSDSHFLAQQTLVTK